MLFNSLEFFIFLPIVFGLYWLVPKKAGWQNAVLLAASLFFYGWWDWRVLGLFILSIGATVAIGRKIEQLRATRLKSAKALTTVGVVILLLVLGFFKYYNFFVDSLAALLSTSTCHLNLILPLGISFYTFMCVSYLVDTYTGKLSSLTTNHQSLIPTLAYLSFFPQISAGPIGRGPQMLPQFSEGRAFSYPLAVEGCRDFIVGMFIKVVVADSCASCANQMLGIPNPSSISTWCAMVLFAIQIYADFSSYSTMAIGVGKLFGIRLMQNFNKPYMAANIGAFWRNWHISLTKWFTDYVYIPLGGNRVGFLKQIRNVWVVFLLSGLWHGAAMTFVVWGGLHALYLSILNIKRRLFGRGNPDSFIQVSLSRVVTWLAVVLGWTFFRAPDIHTGLMWMRKMICFTDWRMTEVGLGFIDKSTLAVAAGMMLVEAICYLRGKDLWPKMRWLRIVLYYAIIITMALWDSTSETFVYFQF